MLMGASFVYTIGNEYIYMRADTQKAYRHIPLFYFRDTDHFIESMPYDSQLVAVEQHERSYGLMEYVHPERAVYLLGTEEEGLPEDIIQTTNHILEIPTLYDLSLNVHVAGSIVMYDRIKKSKL